ncbi:MAG: hypothetical protein ACYDH5_17010 [Acidimicrobiales bacterium]
MRRPGDARRGSGRAGWGGRDGGGAEEGFGLLEQVIALSIMILVLGVVLSSLLEVQTTVATATRRSRSNDLVRLAVARIDAGVRSGNIVYTPSATGSSLLIETQAYGSDSCVEWSLSNQVLYTRSWLVPSAPSAPPASLAWVPMVTHVVNDTLSPPVPLFSLDTAEASFAGRVVSVDVIVNASNTAASAAEARSSVTARNTEFGYPAGACQPVPAPVAP